MKISKTALFYGFLVWVIPFVVAMFIYPLRVNDRPFFESIMPVVVVLATVLFAVKFFARVDRDYLKEGVLLGVVWLVVNIGIDLLMFMWGPMKMTLVDYMKDIGFTYLMIPIITIGFGYILNKNRK